MLSSQIKTKFESSVLEHITKITLQIGVSLADRREIEDRRDISLSVMEIGGFEFSKNASLLEAQGLNQTHVGSVSSSPFLGTTLKATIANNHIRTNHSEVKLNLVES